MDTNTLDLVLVRSPKLSSRLTAWGTRIRKEAPTLATHQLMFYDRHIVQNATGKRDVYFTSWVKYKNMMYSAGYEFAIYAFDTTKIDWEDATSIGQNMMQQMDGWKYSYMELPLHFLDGLIGKSTGRDVKVFRKMGNLWKKGVICSKTGNRVYVRLGWMPSGLEYGSPDDTYDYVFTSPVWEEKFHTAGWIT